MAPCCSENGQCSNIPSVADSEDHSKQNQTTIDGQAPTTCCAGGCACDDTCLEQLARAVCADDDGHIHAPEVTAPCTEAGSLATNDACKTSGEPDSLHGLPVLTAENPEQGGLRKRRSAKVPTSDACSEHKTIVRKRHGDTLAAFGCICKAMLARGLQSCCTSRAPLASSISASLQNLRTASRSKSSLSSCCGDSACVKERASIRSVARKSSTSAESCCDDGHRGKKTKSSRRSLDSCCDGGGCRRIVASSPRSIDTCQASGCCQPTNRAEIRSAARKSSVSVNSCADSCCAGAGPVARRSVACVSSGCADSCCDGPAADDADIDPEKDISSLEKGIADGDNHCVLAVEGMTCVGCEKKLIQVLRSQPLITNIKTSLVLCRAEFDYNCDDSDLKKVIQNIQTRTGFAIEQVAAASSPSARALELATPMPDKLIAMSCPVGVAQAVKVNKNMVRLEYDPRVIGARDVMAAYETCSPSLAPMPPDPTLSAGAKHIRVLLLRTAISALFTIPVLVMTWAPLPSRPRAYGIASLILSTLVQFGIAGPFYRNALKSLFVGIIEIDLLVVLSTTTAYTYSVIAFAFQMVGRPLNGGSFFETSTLLVTLIMLGQLASAFSRQRAVAAISLRSLQPPKAVLVTTLPDGRTQDEIIDARLLHYSDTFRVLPDSFIITDGNILSGASALDESMITGESLPVEKGVGHAVLAGTRNGGGALLVRATRLPGENTISDIADMVDDVRASRAHIQSVVDRVCTWFVPSVLALTIVTFVVWLAVGIRVRGQGSGDAAVRALTYAIAVLAISCPCAIGLAVPMVVLVASGVAARLGIVFKAATTIESARHISHVVFDKTGTLTTGELEVTESVVLEDVLLGRDGSSASTVGAILALASTSKHPVARAIAAHLKADDTASTPDALIDDIEEITSKGVQGTLAGRLFRGGNAKWLGQEKNAHVAPLLEKGYTIFVVTYDGVLRAVFALSDSIRPEVPALLSSLSQRKITVSILSGDHSSAVHRIASALSIPTERTKAGCLPADKAEYIRELQKRGAKVLFCGDGTNDSVALAQADIGVHMPSSATDVAGAAASSAAHAVLTRPSLAGIAALLALSDAVHRRIVLNFVWAAVYNTVAILFAAGAFVNARIAPAYAGLGEIVSVLPVVLIAMQLKWFSV